MLRGCDHPNVVHYHDAFEREHALKQVLWVVMELCSAGSVEDLMKRRGASLPESCIAWVCAGSLAAGK